MLRVFVLIVGLSSFMYSASPETGKNTKSDFLWKAGVATVDITPEGPIWQAGYAARNKPSEGVCQRIHAKALALKSSSCKKPFVLITADLLFISRSVAEEVAARLRDNHELHRSRVVFFASHSHSAPVLEGRTIGMYKFDKENREKVAAYTRTVEDKLYEAARKALDNLAPARLSYGHGRAGFGINRRMVNSDDPVDHDVPVVVIDFAAADGKDLKNERAVVFAYACHNTTLNGYEICGDYAGFAQSDLEEKYPGLTAFFVTGCGADINPSPRRKMEYAKAHGRELAESVSKVLQGRLKPISSGLECAFDLVQIPFAPVPARASLEKQLQDKNVYVKIRAGQLLNQLNSGKGIPPAYSLPIQVMSLGDKKNGFTIIAIGGEVVVDYVLRIKREIGKEGILVAGYANDGPGYIPSERILKEGGYEGGGAMLYFGFHGPWAPGVEKLVMDKIHNLLHAVKVIGP